MPKKAKSRQDARLPAAPPFEPLFKDLFQGATYDYVDPFSCIPFTKIRETTEAGINKLIQLFDSSGSDDVYDQTAGLALGTDAPCVVPLIGSLSSTVYEHLRSSGLSEHDAQAKMNSRDIWYGIVDGLHCNKAICWLINNRPSWKEAQWFVTKLRGGFPVDRYRQLVRFQNTRHSAKYYVSLTLYGELNNLRLEYERLSSAKPNVTNLCVAKTYFGQAKVSRKMNLLASTAVRLSKEALDTLGLIINSASSSSIVLPA